MVAACCFIEPAGIAMPVAVGGERGGSACCVRERASAWKMADVAGGSPTVGPACSDTTSLCPETFPGPISHRLNPASFQSLFRPVGPTPPHHPRIPPFAPIPPGTPRRNFQKLPASIPPSAPPPPSQARPSPPSAPPSQAIVRRLPLRARHALRAQPRPWLGFVGSSSAHDGLQLDSLRRGGGETQGSSESHAPPFICHHHQEISLATCQHI